MIRKGGQDHAQVGGIEGVGLHPLHEAAAGSEPAPDGGVILIGEKRGDARDPRVGWLRDDEVVVFARGEEKIAGVVEMDAEARVAENAAIQFFEDRGRLHHGRLDFDDVNALDIRIAGHSRSGHAAAEADEEDAARRRMKDGAQMADQELRGGVAIRCVHFAVGLEGPVVVGAGDGNGSIEAVGGKEQVGSGGAFGEREMGFAVIPVEDGAEIGQSAVVEERGPAGQRDSHEQGNVQGQCKNARRRDAQLEKQGKNEIDAGDESHDAEGSQQGNEPETGGNGSDDRSAGVGGAGPADGGGIAGALAGRPGKKDYDRGKIEAEDNGCGEHGERAGCQLGEDKPVKRFLGGAKNRRDNQGQILEKDEEKKRGEAGAGLRARERGEPDAAIASRGAGGPALEKGAAQDDASEERGEHQGKGVGGTADDGGEEARPGDFVGDGCGADSSEQNEQKSGSLRILQGGPRSGGHRLESLRRKRPAGEAESDEGREKVEGDSTGDGATQSERGKQDKSGEKRSGDGAERVDPIQAAETSAQFGEISRDAANQDGERSAHQECGKKQDQRSAEKTEQEKKRLCAAECGVGGKIEAANSGEAGKRESAEGSDAEFDPGVERDGAGIGFAPAAENGAARGETSHENRENRGDSINGVAEDETEGFSPGHLIDKPRDAGKEKAGENAEEVFTPGGRRAH